MTVPYQVLLVMEDDGYIDCVDLYRADAGPIEGLPPVQDLLLVPKPEPDLRWVNRRQRRPQHPLRPG